MHKKFICQVSLGYDYLGIINSKVLGTIKKNRVGLDPHHAHHHSGHT